MQSSEIDYFRYPIIVINPDQDTLSWVAELGKDFLFHIICEPHDYAQLLADQKDAAVIVLDQIARDENLLTLMKGNLFQAKTFALLSPDQSDSFTDLMACNGSCQPLFKPCRTEILRLEFAHSIERYIWKKERDLLLAVQRQENWFSLSGQLTREWAHEIRNRAAIISLNAEISMTKIRKQAAHPSNPAETMEKIIEQCLKISKVLDSVREFSNLGQNKLSPAPLTEIINQAIFLIKSEVPGISVHLEKKISADLSLSLGESARLRSALVSILRYYSRTKDELSPVLISIEDSQGFHLKISMNDTETIPFDFSHVDGPFQDMMAADPKMLDFTIGIRLLKSLGGEISMKDAGSGKETILAINLPSDFKQRPLYHE